MAAHPVVAFLQAVEADGDAMHDCLAKRLKARRRESQAVGDNPPWKASLEDALAAKLKVVAQEGLSARDGDKHAVRVGGTGNAVEHTEEIPAGHVAHAGQLAAIAPTMAAADVTPQRTLPEQLPERVFLAYVSADVRGQLKCKMLADAQFFCLARFFHCRRF